MVVKQNTGKHLILHEFRTDERSSARIAIGPSGNYFKWAYVQVIYQLFDNRMVSFEYFFSSEGTL